MCDDQDKESAHMLPDLSVIIPTYNRADLLPNSIRSALNCSVNNLEVIVIDDGSSDGTAGVVAPFADRVDYFWQENAGLSAARNQGFRRSHGRYVAFLDSDDEWLPNVAPKLIEILDRYPEIAVLFTDARFGNEDSGYRSWIDVVGEGRFYALPAREPEPGLRILQREPFFQRLVERNQFTPGATIFRREVYAAFGGYDPILRNAEDWELNLRLASQVTLAFWPKPLHLYQVHSGPRLSTMPEQMARGFAVGLTNVLSKCPNLSDSQRRMVRARLRWHQFSYAYLAYDRGDFAEARRRFTPLLEYGDWQARATVYWCLCNLPAAWLRRLRSMKQFLRM
jgi:glycosyltransferase involved in cell wall biosynthesis